MQFRQQVHQLRSSQGLRILIVEDASVDTVEVDLRVMTGSVADPPGKEGLAHLVEHLMFDVRPGGPGQPSLAEILDEVSLSSNATTTWDYTHYESHARAGSLDRLIAVQAARLRFHCAQVTDAMIEREREVVRNELRQRLGSGGALIALGLNQAIYGGKHPYHRLPGGDEESLMRITRADVCGFVFQHYRADNAMLSVHGAVTADQTTAIMQRHLSRLKARRAVAAPPVVPPWSQEHLGQGALALPVEEPLLAMVLPMPWEHGEGGFMARLLMSDFGWFLRQDKPKYITDIEYLSLGGPWAPVGALIMQLKNNDNLAAAETYMRKKMAAYRRRDSFDFRNNANSKRYYEGLANREITRLLRSIEPVGARGHIYADFAQFVGDSKYVIGAMNRTSQVSGTRMAAYRNDLLHIDKAKFLAIVRDQDAEIQYRRVVLNAPPGAHGVSSWRLPVDPARADRDAFIPKTRSKLNDAEQITLKSGLRVYMLSDLTFPLARVYIEFAGGTIHERAGLGGLAQLSGYLIGSGGMGVRMDTVSDFDFQRLGTSSDSDVNMHETSYFYQGQGRFVDMMIHRLDRQVRGKYSEKVFRELRKNLAELLNQQAMLGTLSREQVITEAIYGRGHPYATREYVSNESLAKISADAITEFRNRYYRARNGALVVVGKFDPRLIEQHVRFSFDDWQREAAPEQPAIGPSRRSRKPAYLAVTPPAPRVQMNIEVVYPSAVGIDKDHAARLVTEAMLEQRLERIREELGVSYGVQASYYNSVGPGKFVIKGAVDSLRAGTALAAIRQSVASLYTVDDSFRRDFIIARRRVAQQLLAGASDSGALARALALIARHRLSLDYFDQLLKRVAGLRPADIERVISTEMAADMATVVCTGKREDIERAYREVGITRPVFVRASPVAAPSPTSGLAHELTAQGNLRVNADRRAAWPPDP